MTQEQVTQIINTHYFDKIQMATLTPTDLNFLLFKLTQGGLKEFKGYSVVLVGLTFETEQDVRTIIDGTISANQDWYNA